MKEFQTCYGTTKHHPKHLPAYIDVENARFLSYKLQEHFMGLAKKLLDLKMENKKVRFDPIYSISCFDIPIGGLDDEDLLRWTITSKFEEEK